MTSSIGKRLGRALDRAGIRQREVAQRARMEESTVSNIITGKTHSPFFATIEKIVRAAGLTWSEVFDEPQIRLSADDAKVAREFQGVLGRVLDNDTKQKDLSRFRGMYVLRDRARDTFDDVEHLANEKIPGEYQRLNANRAFLVHTDAMIEAGVLEGAIIFARASQNIAAADGEIVICDLNGKLYLRRLDLRGGNPTLLATNPRYDEVLVALAAGDRFSLVAVLCMPT